MNKILDQKLFSPEKRLRYVMGPAAVCATVGANPSSAMASGMSLGLSEFDQ
jgi:hypothetical protein